MSVESSQHEETTEQTGEWYVLVGIKGKTLQAAYVKEQFDAKKIKIRGTYSKEEILKYYHNGMISLDTILFKEGDAEWKPLDRQNLVCVDSIATRIAENIKLTGEKKKKFASFVDTLIAYVRENKKLLGAAAAAIVLVYFGYDYYYYKPEQIYDRIKEGVILITTENGEGQTTSLGSGFVVGRDGIIATNLHVISHSATVKIKSGADLSYDAEGVVYIDPINDLALLKIRKKGKDETVSPIQLGKPDDVKVGERVYAVGNPGGLEFSLSEGIVSGKRSEDPISKEARHLIQITAPISPGNSGGPVLNKKGEVVGVATMGSRNDFQNLNFAVPVSVLKDPENHKDMEYKFLPRHPKWTQVSANLDYGRPDGSPDISLRGASSAYYNQETISRHGDKTRAWVRAQVLSPSLSYDDPYGSSPSQYREIIGLVETDCRQNIFRFNILTGVQEDEDSPSRADFSGSKWKPVGDEAKPLFEKICNKS